MWIPWLDAAVSLSAWFSLPRPTVLVISDAKGTKRLATATVKDIKITPD
jgi:hypothetical protein